MLTCPAAMFTRMRGTKNGLRRRNRPRSSSLPALVRSPTCPALKARNECQLFLSNGTPNVVPNENQRFYETFSRMQCHTTPPHRQTPGPALPLLAPKQTPVSLPHNTTLGLDIAPKVLLKDAK
jgi:hypothetical protein